MHRILHLIAALAALTPLAACHCGSRCTRPANPAASATPLADPAPPHAERIAALEQAVEQLRQQLALAESLRQYGPPRFTVIPPITVDPGYNLPDLQRAQELNDQIRIFIDHIPATPDDPPSPPRP